MLQLANQSPSHLIAPAVHMNLDQMAEALAVTAAPEALKPDPAAMMKSSRNWLRRRFIEADMGITGANFGIADTGNFFIVTNEGNGRLTGSLPRVHIGLMGIDRVLLLPGWTRHADLTHEGAVQMRMEGAGSDAQ